MRNFILGVVVTLVAMVLVGLAVTNFGLLATRADATPPSWERHILMGALDASVDRHAQRIDSPVLPTDDNLIDGMKIYTMNCALCHGTLDNKPSPLEKSYYPPAPQLILDPLDDPEWHIYYVVSTGARYTGMPSWRHALSDQDIWKVVQFLSRVEKLPPKVQEYWKNAFGVGPLPPGEEEHPSKAKD
ncbi:MAG TPA: cytochrome c [Terriglobales bacterium]|nr:cytochrome c [Terriglobales bacterium]